MGDAMAVKRFSHAAAKALRLLGDNTRVAARQAYEIMVAELNDPEGNKIARNWSVYSRVLSELWRNGWVSIAGHAQNKAVSAAEGKELRKGPRGGGRELEGIIRHVLGAESGYLARLAWKHKLDESADLSEELERTRQAVLDALAAAAHGELPKRGPRGGAIWTPRYFVRRLGGYTGDLLGATQQATELAIYLGILAAWNFI